MSSIHLDSEPFRWTYFDPLTGGYHSGSWQDGTGTPPGTAFMPSQKSYSYHSPDETTYTLGHATTPQFLQRDHCFDHTQSIRYVSPDASQGSSFSEASYSGESAHSTDTQPSSIRYSTSPANIPTPHTLKLTDSFNGHHMSWLPQTALQQWHVQPVAPSLLASHSFTETNIEDSGLNEGRDMTYVCDNETISLRRRSTIQMPQPEEVELSEPTTNTFTSLPSMHQAKKSIKEYLSEDDMEEDTDLVPVDNESDPDYQSGLRKCKSSRSMKNKNAQSLKHRRKSSSHSTKGNSRIHKRSNSTDSPATSTQNRRLSKSKQARKGPVFVKALTSKATQPVNKADRTFPCTFHHFGCPAEFPNKNEWKRHVACQHLQLGYFRCDMDGCNPEHSAADPSNHRRSSYQANRRTKSEITDDEAGAADQEIVVFYNDFNRKDLFTQHCRRMHGPSRNPTLCTSTNRKGTCVPTKEDLASFERELDTIRRRCWSIRRKAPARSNCGFCDQVFDAIYYTHAASSSTSATGGIDQGPEEKAWEERMEHVGRHHEKDLNARKEAEEIDEDLVAWGISTGVLYRLHDGRPWLVSAEAPCDQPRESSEEAGGDRVKRARRQPSRTVVVQLRSSVKDEEGDSDVDADGEDE